MKSSFKKFITFAAVTAATIAGTAKVAADAAKNEEKEDPVAKFVKENIPVDEILKTVGVKNVVSNVENKEPVKVEKPELKVEKEQEKPKVEKKQEKPKVEEKQEKPEPKVNHEEPKPSFVVNMENTDPRAIKIGDAWITDSIDDDYISIVAAASGYKPDQLVSLKSDNGAPMVFAFSSATVRNDVTLEEVFFVTNSGRAIIPEDTERDNVIAFGKAFITETPELQDYLKY